jgi:glutaredoxin-like YruB-family protein
MHKRTTLFFLSLALLILSGSALAGHRVELYTTSWCPYCERARDFFRAKGISFTEYDVDKDRDAARRMLQLDSRGGVPFVVIDGRGIRGFSRAAYERALEGGN